MTEENTTATVKIKYNANVSKILDDFVETYGHEPDPQVVVDYFMASVILAETIGMELFSQLQVVQESSRMFDLKISDGVDFV